MVSGAMIQFANNQQEIEYLYNYYKGSQPIVYREKKVRPEINNRIVINNALAIVRNANGYFLGEPIKYTSKGGSDKERSDIDSLNEYMDSEDKAANDMDVGESASVCGVGYRLVAVDEKCDEDEAPFEIPTLDARSTFVIYSTDSVKKPVLGVTFSDILDDYGNATGRVYTVYDNTYQYQYEVAGVQTTITAKDLVNGYPKAHLLGAVPIVEYKNNQCRMGDFESVLTILDALNKLHSDRVNSVEQLVNSLLVFVNCHLKTAKENGGTSDFEKMKQGMALEMTSDQQNPADVKYVNSGVNQNEAETLAQTLIDYVYAITGIPDRKAKGGGTGDTGDAVYLRDGYQSLEVVARCKQRNFKKSEKQMLRMVCKILKRFSNIDIKPMDVEVNFVRNRTNNMLNKSQTLSTLMATKVLTPTDAIELSNFTEMPNEMAKRGEEYWKQKADEAAAMLAPTDNTVPTGNEESNAKGSQDGKQSANPADGTGSKGSTVQKVQQKAG
ncbi:phage portal protein [Caproicibacterium amylolyticum]|uniref:phage portal protein n=1 Tax=Caproicibacterium amylolyticum TaxID=2766537 RepID=UPI002484364B|nr:phage portal protein [Caproicibacterium amylolyticum]